MGPPNLSLALSGVKVGMADPTQKPDLGPNGGGCLDLWHLDPNGSSK